MNVLEKILEEIDNMEMIHVNYRRDTFRDGFDCEWMTDTGCERMTAAKNLIIQAIEEGEDIEMCREQCCKGCTKVCGFRCMAIQGG